MHLIGPVGVYPIGVAAYLPKIKGYRMKRSAAMQCLAAAILLMGFANFAVAAVDTPHAAAVVVADVQPVTVATVVPDQFIDAQQLRIDAVVGTVDAATSAAVSAHRTVTAWQVNNGKWNGQILDGLSLVLVQNISTDPTAAADIAIYVSDYATVAQRDGLWKP